MIADIRLQNFRSYKDDKFKFSPNVNIIVGPNASGKTNLLEAILVVSNGKSYRVKDSDLVQFNKEWARLDTRDDIKKTRTVKLTPNQAPSKQFELEGKQYTRLTLNNKLPVVLFEPNHLLLLSGSPERRRDYLDDMLSQTEPGYDSLRRQYTRALSQRNALLKQLHNASDNQIFPWNVRLSSLAGQIVKSRSGLIEVINQRLSDVYKELSGTKTEVGVVYQNQWPMEAYENHLIKNLESNLHSDKIKGFTSSGPHREDFILYFNNRPAQEVASRGEIRTALLALKIIEIDILENIHNYPPILLLDDVFSELDDQRKYLLTKYIKKGQAFITTADAEQVLEHFKNNCNIILLGK